MPECEFHCALCPEKCTLAPGHHGFCNCGSHSNFKHPNATCFYECSHCYSPCSLTGDHDDHRCAQHKKEPEKEFDPFADE